MTALLCDCREQGSQKLHKAEKATAEMVEGGSSEQATSEVWFLLFLFKINLLIVMLFVSFSFFGWQLGYFLVVLEVQH